MRVPLAVVAEVDQREPHALLGQPAGRQQPAAVDRGGRVVDAVEVLIFSGSAVEVEHLRHGLLHPVRQFIALDAGRACSSSGYSTAARLFSSW